MKCRNCGSGVKDKWKFCPNCGAGLKDTDLSINFDLSNVFKHLQEQMNHMDMKRGIDLSKMFDNSEASKRRNGFTVRITRRGENPPNVSVNRFGEAPSENSKSAAVRIPTENNIEKRISIFRKLPNKTEEPKAEIRKFPNGFVIDVSLPGVKSTSDIEITDLQSSMEIRAIAGNKAYFKIINKPDNTTLSNREFSNSKLRLVFS